MFKKVWFRQLGMCRLAAYNVVRNMRQFNAKNKTNLPFHLTLEGMDRRNWNRQRQE